MQEFYQWFLGAELYNACKSLLGVLPSSPETSQSQDEVLLEDIIRSIDEVQSSIIELQQTCDRILTLKKDNEDKYRLRQHTYQKLLKAAQESKHQENIFELRSAIGQSMQIELTLPKFKERVETSQKISIAIQDLYTQLLEVYNLIKIDLETAKIQIKVASSANDLNCSPHLIVLREKVQSVLADTRYRYDEIKFQIQLADSSDCELGKNFSTEEIDDRIRSLDNIA